VQRGLIVRLDLQDTLAATVALLMPPLATSMASALKLLGCSSLTALPCAFARLGASAAKALTLLVLPALLLRLLR
jgi:hypothetical protein